MKSIIFLFVAFLVVIPVLAAESPQSILSDKEVLDWEQRKDLASSLLVSVEQFSSSFPTLTPEEQKYVESELFEGQGERLNRLVNSEEYLIYEVRNDINELRRHLSALERPVLDRGVEMKRWAATSYHLLNSINDNYFLLHGMGVVDGNAALAVWANYYGKEILRKAIAEP